MMLRSIILVSCLGLGLAACGTNRTDRALSGAAIGGAGGAVVGGVASGTVGGAVAGGAIGAAGGAIVGAATTPRRHCYYSRHYGRRVCR